MKASNNLVKAILNLSPPFRVEENAPASLDELRKAVAQQSPIPIHLRTFPVSGEFCENTIWPGPEINQAFRALHDMIHVMHGHEFDLAGEYATALDTDRYLAKNAPYLSDEDRRVLFLEVVAQAEYHTAHGVFPTKQDSFMRSAMDGLFTAIHTH